MNEYLVIGAAVLVGLLIVFGDQLKPLATKLIGRKRSQDEHTKVLCAIDCAQHFKDAGKDDVSQTIMSNLGVLVDESE